MKTTPNPKFLGFSVDEHSDDSQCGHARTDPTPNIFGGLFDSMHFSD
jgi:hypothetical protein